jgi:uncharacterized protein YjiS (DUF1127 family)
MSCSSTCSSKILFHPRQELSHPGILPRLLGALDAVRLMYQRTRQRRALLERDDHLLSDIGLSRDEAAREARKPFWK